MRKEQKQKTSVFSEYQNIENDSITSRQLEFWLKQTAPVRQPRPINEWTLMSANSIFQEDEHPLTRNETFESINKENDMTAFNSTRQPIQNTSSVLKSKSYLNAMTDLQNKVKQLEQENESLKNSLRFLKEDRNRSMSESNCMAEQLKSKIYSLQPKAKKLEQMVKENKKLRDWRQQNAKKIKLMEKMIKQYGQTIANLERESLKLKESATGFFKLSESKELQFEEQQRTIQKLKSQNAKLIQKNRLLEDMKQKSTASVLEKYSKSVNQIQQLTHQNDHLRRQMSLLRTKTQEKLREMQDQNRRQRQEFTTISQRTKQENIEKKELINSLNNQIAYFRQNYQKTNESLLSCLKNHSRQVQQYKEKIIQLKIKLQQKQSQVVYLQLQKEQALNKQSIIKSHGIQMNNKNQVQSQLQFQQFNSLEPEEVEEVPSYETRSAIDKQIKRSNFSKFLVNSKPNDTLSQQNYHEIPLPNAVKKSALKKSSVKAKDIKQHSNEKIKDRSQEKVKSKDRSKQKSRQKSRDFQRNVQRISHDHSFILKSHQPLTQKEIPQHLYYTQDPCFDSEKNRKNVPYYWESNEVAQFGTSQRGIPNQYAPNPSTTEFSLQQALLNEINREGIRLLQAQLSYMQSDKDQHLSPTEKAEHIGRLKQINEQIRINFEKKMQLMQRMKGQ